MMLSWWAWVLVSPLILFLGLKVSIRAYARYLLLSTATDSHSDGFDKHYDLIDQLILRVQEDHAVSQEEVDALAVEFPNSRFFLFFELAICDREDLISDQFASPEEQAIAALACTLEDELDEMPSCYEIIETLCDPEKQGLFFVIAYGISNQEGRDGIGFAGPLHETGLPYRKAAYAFTRSVDTRENVSGQNLLRVWRKEYYGQSTQGMAYRYPSDPPKVRDPNVKRISL